MQEENCHHCCALFGRENEISDCFMSITGLIQLIHSGDILLSKTPQPSKGSVLSVHMLLLKIYIELHACLGLDPEPLENNLMFYEDCE